MKLIKFGPQGSEKPGVILSNGTAIDVSAFTRDFDEAFFESSGLERLSAWLEMNSSNAPQVPAGIRLGAPLARPSKIICIGLNYSDHAKESGMAVPVEPIIFFKSTTALTGPNDGLVIPEGSEKTDWEVELAVVIGKTARSVSEDAAMDYVAGYLLHNDYSERAWQLERGGQWVKGKSADTFAPLGPWLATTDEIPDPHTLRLWLKVNGETKQDGTTANLIFKIPFLVSYVSQFMTLLPGDVISTGTPAGVGLGFKPPQYLKAGDIIELGIPFTDPMADGITIQLAGQRALAAGQSLEKTLQYAREFRKVDETTPIVLMGYYNPIYSRGVDKFLVDAKEAGIDGLIVVDLPPEEDSELCIPAQAAGINFIRLATPTTDDKRLPKVLTNTSGFVYYVSVTGITGTASAQANDVGPEVARIKSHTDLPVIVGFGIKTPQAAADIAAIADGAVVGSAIVERVGAGDSVADVLAFVKSLADGTHSA